ncbi:MAG: prepilin peptidase [Candidatus Pacebacteria bacterium]|nr:prepilin peptidase [Candidatus Paceibacterota bacterium]
MLIYLIFVFIFGLIIGSFLNCVIWRIYKNQSFMSGRSYCPNCKHALAWYDLVPVLSYVLLMGKCRYCKKKISLQYPLVELATALIFVAIYNFLGVNILQGFDFNFYYVLFLWAITAILIVAFVFDLKHYIIPDSVTFSGIIISVIWIVFAFSQNFYTTKDLIDFFAAGLGAAIFFFLIWFFSKGKAIGFGDVKLAFLLGLVLGLPNIFVALFVSFLLGAIIGLILIALKKKKMKSAIPFGPFLIISTFIAFFYGQEIINWYFSLSLR